MARLLFMTVDGKYFTSEAEAEAIRHERLLDMAAAARSQEKAPEKKAAGGKPNALQQPLRPSEELAAVVGPGPLPRTEAVSRVWAYVKANNLQNPANRREILADDRLGRVFGKDRVTMFEMNKHLARHLT